MCKLVTAEYKRIVGNSTGLAAVSGCWWCGGRQRWCGSEIYSNLFLVFAWLLVQERIQCRANLLKKNVVQDATCEVCRAGMEDCDHLLFRCPFSSSVWTSLHVDTAGVQREASMVCPSSGRCAGEVLQLLYSPHMLPAVEAPQWCDFPKLGSLPHSFLGGLHRRSEALAEQVAACRSLCS